jgi:hypothetical protein
MKKSIHTTDLKKIFNNVRTVQGRLQVMLKDPKWIDEARTYAEKQGKELKKIVSTDATRVRKFLEKQRGELEKFQKQIPGEVKKIQGFVKTQRKELEKLLKKASKTKASKGRAGNSKTKPRTTGGVRKKAAASTEASV